MHGTAARVTIILQNLRRVAEEEEAKQPASHSTGAQFLVCCPRIAVGR